MSSRSRRRCPRLFGEVISYVNEEANEGKRLTANLLVLVLSIFDTGHEDRSLVRENQSIWRQILITSIQDGVKHGLVEQEITHPLRDYNVDFWEWQHHFFHFSLQEGDLVGHAVDLDNLLGLFDDGRHVDTDYMLCASFHGEPGVGLSVHGCMYFRSE